MTVDEVMELVDEYRRSGADWEQGEIEKRIRAALEALAAVPAGWVMVPQSPTAAMVDGLARDIVMWWSMSERTGAALYTHLRRLGTAAPYWLPSVIPAGEYVPPKGAVAMAIYLAALNAAPPAPQAEQAPAQAGE